MALTATKVGDKYYYSGHLTVRIFQMTLTGSYVTGGERLGIDDNKGGSGAALMVKFVNNAPVAGGADNHLAKWDKANNKMVVIVQSTGAEHASATIDVDADDWQVEVTFAKFAS